MTSCCIGYKFTFGIRGVALEWICSYLTDRTQQIAYGGHCRRRVPQRIGSGTTTDGLYTLYTADFTYMSLNDTAYVYTSMQIYVSVPVSDETTAIQRLAVCVSSINDWMSASRLCLNPMTTEVQVSRLAASTLVTFLFCRKLSRLLSLHVTLASFSMQS